MATRKYVFKVLNGGTPRKYGECLKHAATQTRFQYDQNGSINRSSKMYVCTAHGDQSLMAEAA